MVTSLPTPPRPRLRLPDLHDHLDRHPSQPTTGAEVTTADGRSLPLVAAKLTGTAQGGIARLVLEQRFENPYDETLHVTYRMPLPADGAASGYAFVLAGRTIVGRVSRKQEARERFERAIAAGHTAALLEQDRADIFTQSIGNLPAREALIARITVDLKLAWLPEGEWELRFPTVIGPRYVAATGSPAEARASRVTTAPEGTRARIQIAIEIRDAIAAGRTASSPSHALTTGAGGVAELRDAGGARLDRDIVLRWPVAGAATGISLATWRPARGDDCYGLVTIVPPAATTRGRALARDLILLVDTSGSMAGGPLETAKAVLALAIESLGDGDRLELIEFSSEPRRYRPEPVHATRGEKQAAIRWLRGLRAGGGTEMQTAVLEALRVLRPGAQRQVVIATDGYIGGEEAVVAQLHAHLPASCRLHFVGVGSSVNRSLATSMARAGRGTEVLCDLGGDPERAAKRLIDRTRLPVLTDVTLEGSCVLGRAPEAVPDVYAASPLVVAVKLGAGELVVRGRTRGEDWERKLRVGMPRPGEGNPAIAALYGRERVADLEARRFAGEDRDGEIERTGLAFQIATRLTPFIAVDERRRVHPAVIHKAVPQELPYGTTAAAFGLRPAASTVDGTPEAFEDAEITGRSVVETLGESPFPAADDVPFGEIELPARRLAFGGPRGTPAVVSEIIDDDIDQLFTADPSGTEDALENELDDSVVAGEFSARAAPVRAETAQELRLSLAPRLFLGDADESPDEAGAFDEAFQEFDDGIDFDDDRSSASPPRAMGDVEGDLDDSALVLELSGRVARGPSERARGLRGRPAPKLFIGRAGELPDEAFNKAFQKLDQRSAQTAEERPEAPPMAAAPEKDVAHFDQDEPTDEYPVMVTERARSSARTPSGSTRQAAPEELEQSLALAPPRIGRPSVAGEPSLARAPAPVQIRSVAGPSGAADPSLARELSKARRRSVATWSAGHEQSPLRSGRSTLFWILAILAILAALAWWLVR